MGTEFHSSEDALPRAFFQNQLGTWLHLAMINNTAKIIIMAKIKRCALLDPMRCRVYVRNETTSACSPITSGRTAGGSKSRLLSAADLPTLLFRANASSESAVPLAIVAAPVISPSVAVGLMRFLADFMPDAASGTIDNEGLLHFVGPGLERLNSAPPRLARWRKPVPSDSTYLFSDLKHLKGDTQPPKVWTGIFRDTFADAQCAQFYADDIGGPALAPDVTHTIIGDEYDHQSSN
ncbi:MAG TPA: hypothetical protein VGF01_15280 [Terracidiphilus sp.]